MKIDFLDNESMTQFYNNEDLVNLVNFAFDHIEEDVFDDILLLITRTSLEKIKIYLEKMESSYSQLDEMELFNSLKKYFLEVYSNKNLPNLRGAFLELLSLNVFKHLYEIYDYSLDCNVCIGDWCSSKTVDIGINCLNQGFVGECKISRKNFNEEHIWNLLDIKSRSDDFFNLFIICLDNKRELCLKLREIKRDEMDLNLNGINIVHRSNFKDFYSGNYEQYNDCFN